VQQERDLLEYRVAERTRELSQAYEQASSANQYKTEFMAKVTHDLRTPLGVILGYAEVMQQGIFGPLSPEQESALQQIVENTRYLNNLMQDLLDGSQIEHAQLKIVYAPFQSREMVKQVCTPLEALARAKNLQFTTYIDPRFPDSLTGDEKRIRQILSNLVSNAIKFTQEGQVKVSFDLPDVDHWSMQVSDTGPGISPEAQATIFQPFWQVDGATASLGYGLGLAIVKQLTHLMEGELSVTSALGQGTIFTVVFPLDPKTVREM
jgi:signal transduction histidine kinase